MLLFANEVLLLRSGNGEWTARVASRYPEFARRHLAILRPWRPDTFVVRACWPGPMSRDECRDREFSQNVEALQQRLRFIRWQSFPLLAMMFVGLPCLYGFLGPAAFLLGLAGVYVQVCVILACLLVERRRVKLPTKTLAFIALESIICVPHSVNIYRKIVAGLLPQDGEPIDLASGLLHAEAAGRLRQDLLKTLETRINLSEGNDARKERLVRYRQHVLDWRSA